MRHLAALAVLACGGPLTDTPSTIAAVMVHVAAPNHLAMAASVPHPPFDADGGLPDGGFYWSASEGESQDVLIGAKVNWSLVSEIGTPRGDDSCTGGAYVTSDAGLNITVAFDGGTCAHAYE